MPTQTPNKTHIHTNTNTTNTHPYNTHSHTHIVGRSERWYARGVAPERSEGTVSEPFGDL